MMRGVEGSNFYSNHNSIIFLKIDLNLLICLHDIDQDFLELVHQLINLVELLNI